jgi:hypothetical protein
MLRETTPTKTKYRDLFPSPSTSSNVKSYLPSPSNTTPSCSLIFHRWQETGRNSCCAHVGAATTESFPWELGGLQSSLCCWNLWYRVQPWPPTQLEDELSRMEGWRCYGLAFGSRYCSNPLHCRCVL